MNHDRGLRQGAQPTPRFRGGPHPGADYMGFLGGPAFGPRGFGGRARKGDVRSAILSLLGEGPTNGYGLIKAIQAKSEGAWRPSPGSVYPTLQQLVDEGLIAPTSEGARAEYTLTDEGRAHVEENQDEIAAAWTQSRNPWKEQGDLLAAARKLAGVVRQVASEGTTEQRASAAAKLDDLRRELYRMLGE
ncbi:PadR family transcriptional regulator [Pseudolysinimonas sp.]|uniref:PadR family transcriptional regulator n=1 Tax=Pseudolysinimonas sp. TaxID=2680009 RepID=UPI003783E38D